VTRPTSHHAQIPDRRCGNCRHAADVEYKRDLLCFHGDDVRREPGCPGQQGPCETVWIGDEMVGIMDGDEYDSVWAERITNWTDVCDEWELEQQRDGKGSGA